MKNNKEYFLSNRNALIRTIKEDENWHNTQESQDFEILSLPGPHRKTIAHFVLRYNKSWIHTEAASRDDILSLTGEIGRTVAEFLIEDYVLPNDHKLLNDKNWLSKIYYGNKTFAHAIAYRSSIWGESNSAAQDYNILSLGRGSLDTVAHVLARWNHSWGLTASAQNPNVLRLTNDEGVSVAHILAEFNKCWAETSAAFEKKIISLTDHNQRKVADILCRNSESWSLRITGDSKSLFKTYGYKIARIVASSLPAGFNFEDVFTLEEVKKDSELPIGKLTDLRTDKGKRTIITSMSFKSPEVALKFCEFNSSFYTNLDCVTGRPILHILTMGGVIDCSYFFKNLKRYHLLFDIYNGITLLELFFSGLDSCVRIGLLDEQILKFKKFEKYDLDDTRQLYFETLIKISALYDEKWVRSEYANNDYYLNKRCRGGTLAHFLSRKSKDWLASVGLLSNKVLLSLNDNGETVVEVIYQSENWHEYQGTYDIHSLNFYFKSNIRVLELVCFKSDWNYTLIDGFQQLFSIKLSSSKTVGEAILDSGNIYFEIKHILECDIGFSWFRDLLSSESWRSGLKSPEKLNKLFSNVLSSVYCSYGFSDFEFLKLVSASLTRLDFDAIDEGLSAKLLSTQIDGVPLYKKVLDGRGYSGIGYTCEAVVIEKLLFEDFDIVDSIHYKEFYNKLRCFAKVCRSLSSSI